MDHLVLDCISEIERYLGKSTTYHYTIMKSKSTDPYFKFFIDDLEKRYNIRVLLVDDYKDIPLVLSELNGRIRSKRVFISGAFSAYDAEIEEYSHELSRSLTSALLDNDYRIVNGIGRRFGTHLIGYANEYLAKYGIKDVEKHLIVKPFVGNEANAAQKKKQQREQVIGQCGAAIFVFGDRDNNSVNSLSGVFEEFEIAWKQHKTIIPIAYPGMVSESIWEKARASLTQFPYLEGKIDLLTSAQTPQKVSELIIQILDSVQDSI